MRETEFVSPTTVLTTDCKKNLVFNQFYILECGFLNLNGLTKIIMEECLRFGGVL